MKNQNTRLIILLLGCFCLLRDAQAVSPAPDGGYPGENTAEGTSALLHSSNDANDAFGIQALYNNTSGNSNTAIGTQAIRDNTTGSYNVGLGNGACGNVTTADHVTCIGAEVWGTNTSHTTYIANVSGTTIPGGNPVYVDFSGQLGTSTSSARFKRDIHDMGGASDSLLALRPVTFRYKTGIDPTGIPQFGLVAEEVEKVNPALIIRDADGKPYSVRYEQINAMLLNEFLKEQRRVQELQGNAEEQREEIHALTATVKEQAAQMQKVSAQIALQKPRPQNIVNNSS